MPVSLEQFLEHVARRGSWMGGGSVAALTAALSAALLEKLTPHRGESRALTRIRRDCLHFIDRDAALFSRVIEATRTTNHARFARRLQAATEVPCRVFEAAHAVAARCRVARQGLKPQLQSDLCCAEALARAAAASAEALVKTNLAWLNEPAYAQTIQRRMRRAAGEAKAIGAERSAGRGGAAGPARAPAR